MKLPSTVIVILCSLLLQLSSIVHKRYASFFNEIEAKTAIFSGSGVLYLVYPLLGYLADVRLNRYRTIKIGLVFLIIGQILAVLFGIGNVIAISEGKHFFHHLPLTALVFFIGLVIIVGLGLFHSNIIQFGLDQLLEAPTPKLIAFIHWYYWSLNVGELLFFYPFTTGYTAFSLAMCDSTRQLTENIDQIFLLSCLVVLILFITLCLVLLCVFKNHFYIEKQGINPFKNIYKVLKYSWKHKVPEHRSAFTYWEEDIPRRIDLGKNKYGGPFTNEQVEDTKTFLHILPLLLSLFGYHLAGDGYSAQEQLQRTSCPSLPVLLLIVFNPLHLSTLVAVVCIPLYRMVLIKIRRLNRITLLTRIWIGLYLSLVQVVISIIVVFNHSSDSLDHSVVYKSTKYTSARDCFAIRTKGFPNQCQPFSDPVDNTYLWFIIPQLLNGLSSLLVSMTVFEFICAQAPRTSKGLFIGLWYATFSLRYLVVANLDIYITSRVPWLIYEGIKLFLVLVSLVLFSFASRFYQYRQRDEIVNYQGMIEDIYARRIEYEQQNLSQSEISPLLANNIT